MRSKSEKSFSRLTQDALRMLGRKKEKNGLLSFDDVRRTLEVVEERYLGYRVVPLDQVIGSVGRYKDFNSGFQVEVHLDKPRLNKIRELMEKEEPLPPVKLYKIGDAYFVLDGNHRVAAAKELEKEFIDAEVTECVVPIPFHVGDQEPHEAILEAEYRLFLKKTRLDVLRPRHTPIEFSTHGRYAVLYQHIIEHRYYLGVERKQEISMDTAVVSWYDTIWMPMVLLIEREGILERFPGRTAGDLYIFIMNHRWMLNQKAGKDVGPEEAVRHFCLEGPCPSMGMDD